MNKRNQEYFIAFGQHLRKVRISKGIGMRELAIIADMEYSHLSKIEHGRTNCTLSTIIILAEALEVNHQELFDFPYPFKFKK